jgi:hypothetical protein
VPSYVLERTKTYNKPIFMDALQMMFDSSRYNGLDFLDG